MVQFQAADDEGATGRRKIQRTPTSGALLNGGGSDEVCDAVQGVGCPGLGVGWSGTPGLLIGSRAMQPVELEKLQSATALHCPADMSMAVREGRG